MTLTGTLKRHDMGTGGWILETDAGDRVALYGSVDRDLAGKRVVVDGQTVDGMGIGMVGSRAMEVRTVAAE